MDEKDFELLIRLDETRNITQAASAMYTTQSAISKRLKAMEMELGADLLIRSRKGVSFTREGEVALEHARQAYASTQRMRAAISDHCGEVQGTLNAGVSINYAQFVLPDVLALYHARYPKVNVHIQSGHSRYLFQQLTQGQLEVVIVRGEHPWTGEKVRLSVERMFTICGKGHSHAGDEELPYIAHKTDPLLEEDMYRWMLERSPNLAKGQLYVDNLISCVELVRRGLGWAIVPEICLQSFDGVAEPLYFQSGNAFERSTYLCCTREAMAMPQVRVFAEVLSEVHGLSVKA